MAVKRSGIPPGLPWVRGLSRETDGRAQWILALDGDAVERYVEYLRTGEVFRLRGPDAVVSAGHGQGRDGRCP